ncbi:MAG: OmpH family outer membrane protein [Candidatus Omnitrophota bacterium]|jgi:Skp family chaperone for outer membrane proteins
MLKKFFIVLTVGIFTLGVAACLAQAKDGKIGYVDLRRAFYEYGKTRTFEDELNKLTDQRQAERTKKVEAISKLRDELELLSGNARNKKQGQVEEKIADLNEYDRATRQQLLNKKNDMFREVIDDIQVVVDGMGKKGDYDYILDSRNIMYSKEDFDLTDEVIKKLNK